MPLFFFASGYLYKRKPIIEFAKHKFQTIVIPYICFGILTSIWGGANDIYFQRGFDSVEYLKGLLLGNYTDIMYNKVLWFLPALFLTVNIYNVLMNFFGRKITYIIIVALAICYLVDWMPLNTIWGFDNAIFYIAFYAMGDYLCEVGLVYKITNMQNSKKFLFVIIIMFITVLISYQGISGKVIRYITSILGIAGCIVCALIIETKVKILQIIGQASLCILCIHVPIGEVIDKILVRIASTTFETLVSQLGWVALRCIIVISICVVADWTILKIFPLALGKKKN
jgi:fucose 4-O-acetylase-like acetyltransferase